MIFAHFIEALNDLSYDAFEYYVELVSTLSSYRRERFLHCYLICNVRRF